MASTEDLKLEFFRRALDHTLGSLPDEEMSFYVNALDYIDSLDKIKLTPEGGYAIRLMNNTGIPSVKGQAVSLSTTTDSAYVAATDRFKVMGFVYEVGVADGSPTWIVVNGLVDALLRDGFGSVRNGSARLSAIVDGRIVVQDSVGYDLPPTSVAYTTGSTASGALENLLITNGASLVIAEVTGVPGIDATFTWSGLEEALDSFQVAGYYNGNHANGVQFYVWNYSGTPAWDSLGITFPINGTSDVVYTNLNLTANHFSSGEMKIRVYHPDAGNTNHRVYLNKLVLYTDADREHFAEVGYCAQDVVAGVDKTTKLALHFN